mgnify:FL=1
MIDFTKIIAEEIAKQIKLDTNEIKGFIEIPSNKDMGDYSFPCFKLAKELRKAPQMIATELKEKLEFDESTISKVEVVGGYLNFFVNAEAIAKSVFEEIDTKKENYGSSNIGEGKNIVIDYSSPNIAKPFHIGHLRSTVIGNSLYKIHKKLGYSCIGINHLGDYGTQFGKLIEGYKRWKDEYNIEENPIDELTKIYIRINNLCKEDEGVLEACRDNFKKLEEKDEYCTALWEKFRNLSLKEFQKVYDLLDIHFDSLNGEAFYSDKMQEIIDILDRTGKLVESEGARVINLDDKQMPPCLIEKSNGSTTYATRDLAAIMYRARTYNFDKALYVTSYEQILHFRQIFEVAKLLGLDEKYIDGLTHIPFGMVQLKTGKMSTREGNIIKLEDLLNEAISRSKEIMDTKNPDLENKDEIAKIIGIGAVIFNDLYNSRIKDEIFDWDEMLNFNGETGPYLQYIYVRTNSIIQKAGYIPELKNVDFSELRNENADKIIKMLYEFENTIKLSAEKYEPYIIARYLIDLAQAFSSFYNNYKIISDDKNAQDARLYLTYCVNIVLKNGAELLGMKMPEKM